MSSRTQTVVMEVAGVHWASSKSIAEATLSRRPGVLSVEANPVSQTANVTFDPDKTSVADLRAGCRTAATTVRASQCRSTSVIRCTKPVPPRRHMPGTVQSTTTPLPMKGTPQLP